MQTQGQTSRDPSRPATAACARATSQTGHAPWRSGTSPALRTVTLAAGRKRVQNSRCGVCTRSYAPTTTRMAPLGPSLLVMDATPSGVRPYVGVVLVTLKIGCGICLTRFDATQNGAFHIGSGSPAGATSVSLATRSGRMSV
eukprot:scaffold41415_cov264-Isochrysis_galbana.AAC.8